MSDDPRPPIEGPLFWFETSAPEVFLTIEEAENGIEPYDVDEGSLFDASGRLLRPIADWNRHRVSIEAAEDDQSHIGELRHRLRVGLGPHDVDESWLDAASLEELVKEQATIEIAERNRMRSRFARKEPFWLAVGIVAIVGILLSQSAITIWKQPSILGDLWVALKVAAALGCFFLLILGIWMLLPRGVREALDGVADFFNLLNWFG